MLKRIAALTCLHSHTAALSIVSVAAVAIYIQCSNFKNAEYAAGVTCLLLCFKFPAFSIID